TVRFTRGVARTPAKAEEYCAAHGIALTDAYGSVLADPEIDGVVLATPHSQHADQVVAAAAAGKHVFCEKPFTLTKADAERAIAATKAAGVVLALGHNRRFLPAVRKLKSLVDEGALGKIINIEGNMSGHVGGRYRDGMWRVSATESPAGGMAGSGIHVIDTMIHLIGPIAEVSAQSFRLVHEFQLDDTTNMLFRFENGATGYLTAMTATAPTFRINVFGDKAAAELRGERMLTVHPIAGETITTEYGEFSTERAQLEAFADAIEGNAPYPVPLEDVLAGIGAFEAVPRSVTERGWVPA
ncbi:MAG: Gfo/Idh/MocA family oxidoreductase, partial [Pseudomonadota bacterium]